MKKNAIFKSAREHTDQLSREVLASVYVVLLCSDLAFFTNLVVFLRQEARAVLQEIMAQTAHWDRGMGDLTDMFSTRDVRRPG